VLCTSSVPSLYAGEKSIFFHITVKFANNINILDVDNVTQVSSVASASIVCPPLLAHLPARAPQRQQFQSHSTIPILTVFWRITMCLERRNVSC
jgi:hypothetical protein